MSNGWKCFRENRRGEMVKDFKDTDEAHAEKEANQTSRICNE